MTESGSMQCLLPQIYKLQNMPQYMDNHDSLEQHLNPSLFFSVPLHYKIDTFSTKNIAMLMKSCKCNKFVNITSFLMTVKCQNYMIPVYCSIPFPVFHLLLQLKLSQLVYVSFLTLLHMFHCQWHIVSQNHSL